MDGGERRSRKTGGSRSSLLLIALPFCVHVSSCLRLTLIVVGSVKKHKGLCVRVCSQLVIHFSKLSLPSKQVP